MSPDTAICRSVGLTSGAVQRADGFRLWLYPSYVLRCGIPLRRHGSRLSAVRAGNILGAMPLPGSRAVLAVRDATRAGSPGQARRTGGWEMAGQPFGGAAGPSPPETYQRFFFPAHVAPFERKSSG